MKKLLVLPSLTITYLIYSFANAENIVTSDSVNDGFVTIDTQFVYKDGPQLFICDKTKRRVVALSDEKKCATKKIVVPPLWSLESVKYNYSNKHDGITPQAYLDFKYGDGVVKFVGLGTQRQVGSFRLYSQVTLFYKIK